MPNASLFRAHNHAFSARADRLRFLVDAAEYYPFLLECLEQAQRSILIAGWNISAHVSLKGPEEEVFLSDLLWRLVTERPELQIYMLGWNFPFLLMPGRDLPPSLNRNWKEHPRIHHRIDDFHPVGACHHQKIVVIDNDIAFFGGLDVCEERWDRGPHLAHNPERRASDGDPYEAFHDIQCCVQGPVAHELGGIIRRRWEISLDERVVGAESHRRLTWPPSQAPSMENVEVGISLTYPHFGGQTERREVEAMTRDLIRQTEQCLYIENQYLSSELVENEIALLLARPQAPEVIIVLPQKPNNWIEGATVGVLQSRLVRRLRSKDPAQRLGIYYPSVPDLGEGRISVHSKLMIIDDRYVKIGSSNLDHRSMGLDTECDGTVAAEGRDDIRQAIASFRRRLLCEHLNLDETSFERESKKFPGLIPFIASRARHDFALRPLDMKIPRILMWLSWGRTFDPDRPMPREEILSEFLKDSDKSYPRHRSWTYPVFFVFFFLLLSLIWTQSRPFNDALREASNTCQYGATLLFFFVGGSLLLPPVLLLFVSFFVLGPVEGFWASWMGISLCCTLQYLWGRVLPPHQIREAIRRSRSVFPNQVAYLRRLPNFMLRMLAMMPIMVFNVVSGAERMPIRRFIVYQTASSWPVMFSFSLAIGFTEWLSRSMGAEWVSRFFLAAATGAALLALRAALFRRVTLRRT